MSSWLDQAVVASLVIASAMFAVFRLGPAPLRLWMRRQWARLRGKPMPVAQAGGCGDCANAPVHKPRGETRIAADNIRKLEIRPRS
ncbi:MAG TPA: hypothetical protein VE046_13065 [Steroidobacteraceae bacterium]|nr:hypothetical protein [Steroidobacteraceae bacterium]